MGGGAGSAGARPGAGGGRRVVVTGIGLLTGLGAGAAEGFAAACSAPAVVSTVTAQRSRFRAAALPAGALESCPLPGAARAELAALASRGVDVDRDVELQLAVTALCLADSGLAVDPEENELGVVLGAEAHGLGPLERELHRLLEAQGGPAPEGGLVAAEEAFSRRFLKSWLSSQAFVNVHLLCRGFGLHGPSTVLNNGSASGLYALERAAQEIQLGNTEAMLAVAAESSLLQFKHQLFERLGIYSRRGVMSPFTAGRDGFVFGEGGAALLLEERGAAQARGARIYGEYRGGAFSSDAGGLLRPAADLRQLVRTIRQALGRAGVGGGELDFVSPHGTATPINDATEAAALHAALGPEVAARLPLHPLKPLTGHTMGASGLTESALVLLALHHHRLPPLPGHDGNDAALPPLTVLASGREGPLELALKLSLGFGGFNGAVVFSRG